VKSTRSSSQPTWTRRLKTWQRPKAPPSYARSRTNGRRSCSQPCRRRAKIKTFRFVFFSFAVTFRLQWSSASIDTLRRLFDQALVNAIDAALKKGLDIEAEVVRSANDLVSSMRGEVAAMARQQSQKEARKAVRTVTRPKCSLILSLAFSSHYADSTLRQLRPRRPKTTRAAHAKPRRNGANNNCPSSERHWLPQPT